MVIFQEPEFEKIKGMKDNELGITWAVVEGENRCTDEDKCCNENYYDIIVELNYPKDDYDTIPLGENHYEQIVVIFKRNRDGFFIWRRRKAKTLAKKYIQLAVLQETKKLNERLNKRNK